MDEAGEVKMPGRPRTMLKRLKKLEDQVGEAWSFLLKTMPRRYENWHKQPPPPDDAVANLWAEVHGGLMDLSYGLIRLRLEIAERADLDIDEIDAQDGIGG